MNKRIFALITILVILAVAVAYGNDMQTAIRNADKKLKANHFLLTDEIDEIYEKEKTPDVLEKISIDQQKAIVEELKTAKEINAQKSLGFGSSIKDPLEQAVYQDGVLNNMMLKSSREIAKKYGIKAGDVFYIELNLMAENLNW